MPRLRDFLQSESGLTATEYGLLAGLVAVGVMAAAISISNALSVVLLGAGTHIDRPIPSGGPAVICEGMNCR